MQACGVIFPFSWDSLKLVLVALRNFGKVCFVSQRPLLAAVDQRESREVELRDAELAERVNEATFEQVKAKVESDIALLESRAESPTGEPC